MTLDNLELDLSPKNGTHYTATDPPPKVRVECKEKSRTRQSEAKSADINTIMKGYEASGMLPQVGTDPLFQDVSEMPDYRTSLDMINAANTMFMNLPAELRKKFDNDPAEFLDFTSDPENRDEMIELGMLPKPEKAAPEVPPVETPPAEEGVS